MDNDGKEEIFSIWPDTISVTAAKGIKIYENNGNNSYKLVYFNHQNYHLHCADAYVFGDFDRDGKKGWFEIVGSISGDTSIIWECVGDNRYEPVWGDHHHWINVSDVWLGNDTDGDGMPEIFIKSDFYGPTTSVLSMYEATGDDTYKLTVIDTIKGGNPAEGTSACGDVDGDGREEVVVSIGTKVIVYKAIGDDKYERVWEWWQDDGTSFLRSAAVSCHDFNKNGYDEIIVTGDHQTSIFEIDTTYGITSRPPIVKPPNLSISPNPAKKSTVISLQLPVKEIINLKVYDVTGRLIKTLVKAQSLEPKTYTIKWDGRDNKGNPLPSGVYFVRLEAGGITKTEKVILIR